jgi:hypothetical protein
MSARDRINNVMALLRPVGDRPPKELPDEDAQWIEERMARVANSQGRSQDFEDILLAGMTPGEERAFCLGVRAGKHQSALVVLQMIREFGPKVAKELDPYIK